MWFCCQRQASLSTLQSKMAKQKAEMKKDLSNSAKKTKKTDNVDAQADNQINIKLTELTTIDEEKKPLPLALPGPKDNGKVTVKKEDTDKKASKTKKKAKKTSIAEMDEIKIQVDWRCRSLCDDVLIRMFSEGVAAIPCSLTWKLGVHIF